MKNKKTAVFISGLSVIFVSISFYLVICGFYYLASFSFLISAGLFLIVRSENFFASFDRLNFIFSQKQNRVINILNIIMIFGVVIGLISSVFTSYLLFSLGFLAIVASLFFVTIIKYQSFRD